MLTSMVPAVYLDTLDVVLLYNKQTISVIFCSYIAE